MNLTDFTYVTVAVAAIAHTLDKLILWAEALLPKAEAVATTVAADLPKLAPVLAKTQVEVAKVEAEVVPAPDVVA